MGTKISPIFANYLMYVNYAKNRIFTYFSWKKYVDAIIRAVPEISLNTNIDIDIVDKYFLMDSQNFGWLWSVMFNKF